MVSIKNRAIAAVGGVGLTLAIAVGAVAAGGAHGGASTPTAGSASPSTVANTTTTSMVTTTDFSLANFGDLGSFISAGGFAAGGIGMAPDPAKCQDVASKLAANLGVTTDALQAAIKKTLLQQIDENEKSGKLTADQAKAARDRVNSTTDFCAGLGTHIAGPGGDRPTGGMGGGMGIGMMDSATYQAVATYFGISTDQLQTELKDTGSLQGVAAKHGKDNTADKAGLEAAMEQSLKADLAKRGLQQTMIDQIVAQFKANFDTLYTAKLGQGMPFGPGGQAMPGGQNHTPGQRPGGPRPSSSPSPTSRTQ